MIPGEFIIADGNIECNVGKETVKVKVTNKGDRPIQVGSHFHFYEVNPLLEMDRQLAFGKRLNIAASTAVRFEPGESKEVELVELGGARKAYGHNNLVNGSTKEGVNSIVETIEKNQYELEYK